MQVKIVIAGFCRGTDRRGIGFEIVEADLDTFPCGGIRPHAGHGELAVSSGDLGLYPVDSEVPVATRRNGVEYARVQRTVWYQGAATLLRNADKPFLHRLLVDIGKVDIVKLHPTDLLQLLFDPSPRLEGVFQAASHGFLVVLFVGVQKLQ